MNILDFYTKKSRNEKISIVTCYDYSSARVLAQTNVDCLLVGDSVAMTMHGYKDTLSATIPMMCAHISAVSRGAEKKFIIGDLPFLSYRKSLTKSVEAALALMQAGAHAVKLEGAHGNEKLIRHLTESGVPVMGHLGLTPQFINILGGYKVQGKTESSSERIKADALALQRAGCFSIVLECITADLAKDITAQLDIPTIGIGAGPDVDGQVLVFQDMLGINIDFSPKFVKLFANLGEQIQNGMNAYVNAINTGEFPTDEHSFRNTTMANHQKTIAG